MEWLKPHSKASLLNNQGFLRKKVPNLKDPGQTRYQAISFIHITQHSHFSSSRIPWFYKQETKCCHSQSMAVHQWRKKEKKNLLFEKQLLFIHIIFSAPGYDHYHLGCGFHTLSVQHTVLGKNGDSQMKTAWEGLEEMPRYWTRCLETEALWISPCWYKTIRLGTSQKHLLIFIAQVPKGRTS